MFVFANSMVTDFHAAQAARAILHERAIVRKAEQDPEGLAAVMRANPRILNCLSDPEEVAALMVDAGYTELCDSIAHSLEVTREVRQGFKARGMVDFF